MAESNFEYALKVIAQAVMEEVAESGILTQQDKDVQFAVDIMREEVGKFASESLDKDYEYFDVRAAVLQMGLKCGDLAVEAIKDKCLERIKLVSEK